jgi:hypothetical protein
MSLDLARTVADAVLYEGYLLYPYRATSQKNQARWQFGVLGPPAAAESGVGEEPAMSVECLLNLPKIRGSRNPTPAVTVHLRFLQLQRRGVETADPSHPSGFVPADQLVVDDELVFSWDEAVEQEVSWPAFSVRELADGICRPVTIGGGDQTEPLRTSDGSSVGRIVRRRWPLTAELRAQTSEVDGYLRLSISVENTTVLAARAEARSAHALPRATARAQSPEDAVRTSLIGTHLILQATGTGFVSLLEPPAAAAVAAARCRQHRCWPVLAGQPGSTDVVLASPIILYDHPEVAPQSAGALFDSTEIDEILTLRVMTMTDAEKAEARATDPRAREIVDRCDQTTPEMLQQLHGILREPRARAVEPPAWSDQTDAEPAPWWDPGTDESVRPDVDAVLINGVSVSKGSLVRIHPSRRADAQDLFFAGQDAQVMAVVSDVDGAVHVAVVLRDDPAADLHDWYGRYLYFAPEELEPLPDQVMTGDRKEGQS